MIDTLGTVGALDARIVGEVVDVALTPGQEYTDPWGARWLLDAGAAGLVWVTATGSMDTISRLGLVREGATVEVMGRPCPLSPEVGGGFYLAAETWRRIEARKAARFSWVMVRIGYAIGTLLGALDVARAQRRQPRDPADRVGRKTEAIR